MSGCSVYADMAVFHPKFRTISESTSMKIFHILVCLTLALTGALARADDYTDGIALYEAEDYPAAMAAFQKAAETGHANAQFNLGLMYLNGEGVPVNYAQARNWLSKSAEQENIRALV